MGYAAQRLTPSRYPRWSAVRGIVRPFVRRTSRSGRQTITLGSNEPTFPDDQSYDRSIGLPGVDPLDPKNPLVQPVSPTALVWLLTAQGSSFSAASHNREQ